MFQWRLGDVSKVDELFNIVAGNGVFVSFNEKAALSFIGWFKVSSVPICTFVFELGGDS